MYLSGVTYVHGYIFKTITDQTEKQFEPYFKFNKLAAKNVQTMTELQMNAMQTYTDMGLAQMKAVSEIKDVNSLTAFNSQQLAALTQLSQQMMSDSAKLQAVAAKRVQKWRCWNTNDWKLENSYISSINKKSPSSQHSAYREARWRFSDYWSHVMFQHFFFGLPC